MKENNTSSMFAQRSIRIEKIKKLREIGIDPYPSGSERDTQICDIINKFSDYEGKAAVIAGKIRAIRNQGEIAFIDLQEESGSIQAIVKSTELSAESQFNFTNLDLLDIGDLIEVKGIIALSKKGQQSIDASKIKILGKALRPTPKSWYGLVDEETKIRQRYLDLTINPSKMEVFRKTAQIVFAIRSFFYQKGFLEIKTPILQYIHGGTSARPFKTHLNALDIDMSLAISHELYLKRLIGAGFEKVFNINGYFRNEGIDRTHNPEFQMLETMSAYKNYEYNMELIEELYYYIAQTVIGKFEYKLGDHVIELTRHWERLPMIDALRKYENTDFDKIKDLSAAIELVVKKLGKNTEIPATVGECMVLLFEELVAPKLIQPIFITGHPVEISPLARAMDSDKRFVERFEIYMGGVEMGDNWTELTDPIELFSRFKFQIDRSNRTKDQNYEKLDLDFIEMMEYGMPPTTGIGPGIERLVMLFTESAHIDDVIFFPLLKPKELDPEQRLIYGLSENSLQKVREVKKSKYGTSK